MIQSKNLTFYVTLQIVESIALSLNLFLYSTASNYWPTILMNQVEFEEFALSYSILSPPVSFIQKVS